MKPSLLALALPLLLACGEDTAGVQAATKKAIDSAAGAAKEVVDELAEIDLSSLSPAALEEKAGEAYRWLAESLEQVRDSETAQAVAAKLEPVVDELSALATRLGDELPNRDEVADEIDALRERFPPDSRVREVLDPVLEKLSDALR